MSALEAFAAEIGPDAPVSVRGGGTKGDLGGSLDPGTAVVAAPVGIGDLQPRELVVSVGAGTPLDLVQAELRAVGQCLALEGPPGATVGGVVACGQGGLHARGLGPVRDSVLGARAVDSWGRVVRAGGATVKNVSGFDLCRLWTGSLGTLALLGELTLRTRPLREGGQWVCGPADPGAVDRLATRSSSVLWDGTSVWVHVIGHPSDVSDQLRALAAAGCSTQVEGPPPLPAHRHSLDPARLLDPAPARRGPWVAELGVGVLHSSDPAEPTPVPLQLYELHRRVKERFDPTGRLNPGRSVLHDARVDP